MFTFIYNPNHSIEEALELAAEEHKLEGYYMDAIRRSDGFISIEAFA